MTFAALVNPPAGGTLPEAGTVELVELVRVEDRVELAEVVVVMFSGWVFVAFCESTLEVAVELVV